MDLPPVPQDPVGRLHSVDVLKGIAAGIILSFSGRFRVVQARGYVSARGRDIYHLEDLDVHCCTEPGATREH